MTKNMCIDLYNMFRREQNQDEQCSKQNVI